MSAAGWLAATVGLYLAARALYARLRTPLASPLLLAPAALVLALLGRHAGYDVYMRGGRWLLALLGPTTVAFALPLHRHRAQLREQAAELGAAVLVGSAVAVGSSLALSRAFGLGGEVTRSLAPRSITTPFAMLVARQLGGAPALAAVCVILTALVGLLVGPSLAAR
ncbi:MAG TPA: LrgB family protein, partial [Anaeromyxobacteraceae bacterium]